MKLLTLCHIIALICITYQIIDLTITYCEFQTVIEVKTHEKYIYSYAVTICIKSRELIAKLPNIKSTQHNHTFGELLCNYIFNDYDAKQLCDKSVEKSKTASQLYCLTFTKHEN